MANPSIAKKLTTVQKPQSTTSKGGEISKKLVRAISQTSIVTSSQVAIGKDKDNFTTGGASNNPTPLAANTVKSNAIKRKPSIPKVMTTTIPTDASPA